MTTNSEQLSLLAAGREKQKQKRERKAARTLAIVIARTLGDFEDVGHCDRNVRRLLAAVLHRGARTAVLRGRDGRVPGDSGERHCLARLRQQSPQPSHLHYLQPRLPVRFP